MMPIVITVYVFRRITIRYRHSLERNDSQGNGPGIWHQTCFFFSFFFLITKRIISFYYNYLVLATTGVSRPVKKDWPSNVGLQHAFPLRDFQVFISQEVNMKTRGFLMYDNTLTGSRPM